MCYDAWYLGFQCAFLSAFTDWNVYAFNRLLKLFCSLALRTSRCSCSRQTAQCISHHSQTNRQRRRQQRRQPRCSTQRFSRTLPPIKMPQLPLSLHYSTTSSTNRPLSLVRHPLCPPCPFPRLYGIVPFSLKMMIFVEGDLFSLKRGIVL